MKAQQKVEDEKMKVKTSEVRKSCEDENMKTKQAF